METVFILAQAYSTTPFFLFDRETDEVISVINHHLQRAKNVSEEPTILTENKNKEKRKKVNDKTATGGWF